MSAPTVPLGLVILGASGRMGRCLLRLLPEFPALRLRAAVCSPESALLGRDCGEAVGLPATGVLLTSGLASAVDGAGLVLDFSTAAAAAGHVRQCAAAGAPLLIGTTGLGAELAPLIESAADRIPILVAPNTSPGAAVLMGLVRQAAAALGVGYDVSILDRHHRGKRDAPSGTALALGAAAREGVPGDTRPVVDYAWIRGGDAVGQHDVHFLGTGEWLRLSHNVTDRAVFARGALRAGLWLARKAPGRYAMTDVAEEK